MAKWGEGDPRWIVEDRPDAVNVNNWHWTERNATQWSIDRLKKLFVNFEIFMPNSGFVTINEVERCEGEASANNRRGKIITFYDWDIVLTWKGRVTMVGCSDNNVEGRILIPNFSDENDLYDVDIKISMDDNVSGEALAVKHALYSEGRASIREQLRKYIVALKNEFTEGMLLPRRANQPAPLSESEQPMTVSFSNHSLGETEKPEKKKVSSTNLKTETLNFNLTFVCTGEDFYNAMTQDRLVSAFTNGPAKIDLKEGGKFEMFGGNISGEFKELVPNTKIVQTWRFKSWRPGHYSTVTMDIKQKTDHTQVTVTQTDVPAGDAENTRINWERYYWEAMKRTLGFGVVL